MTSSAPHRGFTPRHHEPRRPHLSDIPAPPHRPQVRVHPTPPPGAPAPRGAGPCPGGILPADPGLQSLGACTGDPPRDDSHAPPPPPVAQVGLTRSLALACGKHCPPLSSAKIRPTRCHETISRSLKRIAVPDEPPTRVCVGATPTTPHSLSLLRSSEGQSFPFLISAGLVHVQKRSGHGASGLTPPSHVTIACILIHRRPLPVSSCLTNILTLGSLAFPWEKSEMTSDQRY